MEDFHELFLFSGVVPGDDVHHGLVVEALGLHQAVETFRVSGVRAYLGYYFSVLQLSGQERDTGDVVLGQLDEGRLEVPGQVVGEGQGPELGRGPVKLVRVPEHVLGIVLDHIEQALGDLVLTGGDRTHLLVDIVGEILLGQDPGHAADVFVEDFLEILFLVALDRGPFEPVDGVLGEAPGLEFVGH